MCLKTSEKHNTTDYLYWYRFLQERGPSLPRVYCILPKQLNSNVLIGQLFQLWMNRQTQTLLTLVVEANLEYTGHMRRKNPILAYT